MMYKGLFIEYLRNVIIYKGIVINYNLFCIYHGSISNSDKLIHLFLLNRYQTTHFQNCAGENEGNVP